MPESLASIGNSAFSYYSNADKSPKTVVCKAVNPPTVTSSISNLKSTVLIISQSPINNKDCQRLAKNFVDFCFSVNEKELKDDKVKIFGEQEIIFKH